MALALIHDNIDLADLVWTGTGSASYTANTATSGVLTVTDGNGHSEQFNLINYTGSGAFTVQSDGNGGSLVFDPPSQSGAVDNPSFVSVGGEPSLPHFDGAASNFNFVSGSPAKATVDQNLDRLSDSQVGFKPFALTDWHLAIDQAKSDLAPGSTLPHEGTTGSFGNSAAEEVAWTWEHDGTDNFQVKPELGASNSNGFAEFADSFSLKHATSVENADFQAVARPMIFDIITEASHAESVISIASSHPTPHDHFSSCHLWT